MNNWDHSSYRDQGQILVFTDITNILSVFSRSLIKRRFGVDRRCHWSLQEIWPASSGSLTSPRSKDVWDHWSQQHVGHILKIPAFTKILNSLSSSLILPKSWKDLRHLLSASLKSLSLPKSWLKFEINDLTKVLGGFPGWCALPYFWRKLRDHRSYDTVGCVIETIYLTRIWDRSLRSEILLKF